VNPHLERAILLYQQSRHELAEAELGQALAFDPDDAYAHALLAMCLADREKFEDATTEARQAIQLAPDFPFAHYAHARVLYDRNHHPEARAAVEEAIRLDPEDADYHSLLAGIHFDEKRWPDVLNAAEQGLQLDAEHTGCTNLRAMAMVKLGRKAEAGAAIDAALAKNPDNALTHANQGWTLLEQGEPRKALEHFREALRLDPENEWARSGIVEALKARNIIYAVMLKYFLWMSKLSRRAQWGIILVGYFGNRLLGAAARSNPDLASWLLPIRILYVAFALMTWLAYPLFNLMLRLNRFGRLALSREQIVASNWVGVCVFATLVGLAGCMLYGMDSLWLFVALVSGFLMLPVAGVFRCSEGWPRNLMAACTVVLALLGLSLLALVVGAEFRLMDETKSVVSAIKGLIGIFLIGAVASTWLTNILISQRPRR
jgi:tetratricopeptide (TPR) repeat protein